jgi:hypothetical protein
VLVLVLLLMVLLVLMMLLGSITLVLNPYLNFPHK